MRELIEFLNYHTKLYNEGHPTISDKEWDDAYFRLKQMEEKDGIIYPDSPTQTLHYEVKDEINTVYHNHKMLSLDKTKDWREFINHFAIGKDVVGMPKLDGLTCSLRYVNGNLVSAETRGNGIVGSDILHNAKVIKNIPQTISYKDELILDGEIICTYEDFEPFADNYSNPRNFAAGSIVLLDSKECRKRNLSFIVWNIVDGFNDTNSFMEKLYRVERVGFTITPWTSSFDWDAKEFLVDKANELGYPIDGLVGRYDDIEYGKSLGETDHHSRAAYAFKFYDEEYDTRLLNIEWSMGRTGILTPVAIFEPIDDGVSVIERASLHNLNIMKELLDVAYYGQDIKVFKANQIIPQVRSGRKDYIVNFDDPIPFPEVCPICGEKLKVVESHSGTKNLVCVNAACGGKLVNQLDHFCGKKGLDIKGLSINTLNKLIDWGWVNSREDIFTLSDHRSEWIKKSGFGEKSVDKILAAIEESKKCDLANFIASLGIPLIGSTISKDLANHFKTWGALMSAIDDNFDFENLPNFGYAINKNLYDFDWSLAEDIINKGGLSISNVIDTVEEETNNLDGVTFVITGKISHYKNRDELKAVIESKGGKVAGSVSTKTNYLINNDTTSTSAKNLAAQRLGIPIINESEFIEKFLI